MAVRRKDLDAPEFAQVRQPVSGRLIYLVDGGLKRRDDALGIASGASADLADSVDVTAKFR